MTLYLKYRPQKIADLDLVSVRTGLQNILRAKTLPHAFLFTGPRGVGKTSSARILAKAINCIQKVDIEPCGNCELCVGITAGTSPDVIEIDAASNRGIDEIRILREQVGLAPMQAKYKVYIIDEVHMLTIEAMNALLKTLEEPPEHVIFVLCTTEAEKILQTVVSRCVQIKFGQPTLVEIVDKLKLVTNSEGWKIDDNGLKSIAKASKGSFRDAIKLVEQVGASGGEVDRVLGTLKGAGPEEFLTFIGSRDVQGGLKLIEQVVNSGISPKQFIERIVEQLHEQLIESVNQKSGQTGQIVGLIGQLEKVYEQTRMAAVAQLPLELFVISFGETEAKSVPTKPVGETVVPVVTVKLETKPEPPAAAQQIKTESKPATVAETVLVSDYKADMNLSDLQPKWPEILKWVKNKNNSIEALLRSTTPKNFDGQTLELVVFYAFHKDKLESEKCRLIIEEALSGVFNRSKMKVKLSLGEKKSVSNAPAAKNIENVKGVVDQDIVTAAEAIFGVQAV